MLNDLLTEGNALALLGCAGGILLGLAARLGRFCTLGAIEDALYGGSTARLRMWSVAIGGSVVLTFAAATLGLADLGASVYLSVEFSPLSVILGSAIFGYGMAIAGNCGFGALARLGGGDLRSFLIVVVMGLSALAVLSGPFARLRLALFPVEQANETQGLAHGLGMLTGIPSEIVGIFIGGLILMLALSDRHYRRNYASIAWGGAIAVAIAGAWVGTTWVSQTGFAATPVVSHTFAAPLGGTMLWFMTASGTTLNFAIGSVTGVWIGAFLGSLIRGQFRWEACDDPRELRRQILGAGLMGGGAVLAMGCSVGQGLSAFSVLSYSAPLAVLSMFIGAAVGLRQLITGFRTA